MSLILDALKKSEQSRPPTPESGWLSPSGGRRSSRVPAWAWAVIVLLVINVLILISVLIRGEPVSQKVDASIAIPEAADIEIKESDVAPVANSESRFEAVGRTSPSPATPARRPEVAAVEPPRTDLPSRDTLLAQGANIPPASITLHVFDTQRNARFILLDGERLGEGDTSRSGLRVNAITVDGVVFAFGNNSFKVSIQ